MKLYPDMLIPFMPEGNLVDGKLVPDLKKAATRNAVFMLANFKSNQNVTALYEAAYQISLFAEVNITDVLLSLEEEDVEVDVSDIEAFLGDTIMTLFKTNSSKFDMATFDYKKIIAGLLNIAHTVLVLQNQQVVTANPTESTSSGSETVPEDTDIK